MNLEAYMNKFHIDKQQHIIKSKEKLPAELKQLLEQYEGAELPFGEIFDYKTMQEMSQKPPFNNEWLIFGRDNFFSFWVCKANGQPGEDIYTTWDHEMEATIGEPAYSSLAEFLADCENEYDDYEDSDATYTVILYKKASLSTLMLIKNILSLPLSSKDLLAKSKLCPCILGIVSHKDVKKAEDKTFGFLKQYVRFSQRD